LPSAARNTTKHSLHPVATAAALCQPRHDDRGSDDSAVRAPGSMADAIPQLVRSFLREEYAQVDPQLPAILAELRRVGATECW
jgi:hypothetical protein